MVASRWIVVVRQDDWSIPSAVPCDRQGQRAVLVGSARSALRRLVSERHFPLEPSEPSVTTWVVVPSTLSDCRPLLLLLMQSWRVQGRRRATEAHVWLIQLQGGREQSDAPRHKLRTYVRTSSAAHSFILTSPNPAMYVAQMLAGIGRPSVIRLFVSTLSSSSRILPTDTVP